MRIGIIGAGLGGLLSGTALAKEGHQVTIFERLPYHGGRFTNIEYKGFQLSTGALHLIPHGATGPLGTMLRRLGVEVSIVVTSPPGLFRFDGKDYTYKQLSDLFGYWNKVKLLKLISDLRYTNGGDETYIEWVGKRISHHKIFDLANSFCRWALSLDADEVSSREVVGITKNLDRYGPPGVPIGGCRAVTDGLASVFKKNGGEIKYGVDVEEIHIRDGRAAGLSTSDEDFEFDAVISNIGPKGTVSLCGKEKFDAGYVEEISRVEPSNGIKISFSSNRPLVGKTTTLFTPEAKRVGGVVELTHIDPSLSPDKRHLLMSHQKLYGNDVEKEIDEGLLDLRNIFPDFDRDCEVLMVQCYKNHWPVNRVASGTHISPGTPIIGLYNVGDGIKTPGLMETEGVAAGVELMLEKFNKDMAGF